MFSSIALLIVLYVAARYYLQYINKAKYWIWDDGKDGFVNKRQKIDTDKIHFPRDFLWGTASSAHQIEGGHTNNNWVEFEGKKNADGEPTIKNHDKCGDSADHWNRVDEDIALMKEIGVNAYRFSLSWDKLEPEEGQWDEAAIQHYHYELDALRRAGIVPMITLHHFTEPLWFCRRGGFTTDLGVDLFVRFSLRCYELFGSKCQLWCTINEPEVYVAGGWFSGIFPPAKKDNLQEGAIVLRNLLEAHVRVYYGIKALPNGETSQIGLVKDVFQFEPWNPLNPLDRYVANTIDHSFNGCIFDFFKTGKFNFSMGGAKLQHTNLKAVRANDFIGLNYYSHHHVKFQLPLNGQPPFDLVHKPGTLMTDMNYPLYPEGFYRALMTVNELGIPIYVTENGLADATDDRRALWLRRYLYALSKAIQDGCHVKGYFWWSLVDNFEWAEGWNMKFGLYELDRATQKRTLRDGSKYYQRVIREHSTR